MNTSDPKIIPIGRRLNAAGARVDPSELLVTSIALGVASTAVHISEHPEGMVGLIEQLRADGITLDSDAEAWCRGVGMWVGVQVGAFLLAAANSGHQKDGAA